MERSRESIGISLAAARKFSYEGEYKMRKSTFILAILLVAVVSFNVGHFEGKWESNRWHSKNPPQQVANFKHILKGFALKGGCYTPETRDTLFENIVDEGMTQNPKDVCKVLPLNEMPSGVDFDDSPVVH